MAIPVARVHLAMAHAALPGLLPTPPRCMMLLLPPLLPPPPCAVILPNKSPPRPSRADAADRWDAGKTKPAGGSPAPSCSGSQSSMGRKSNSPGCASSCESRVGNDSRNKSAAAGAAAAASSSSSCCSSCFTFSSYGSCSDDSEYDESSDAQEKSSSSFSASSYYRTQTRHVSRRVTTKADSDERWDAHKKPAASPAASSASGNRTKARNTGRRPTPTNSRASSASAERWDAHKQLQPRAPPPPPAEELDDGESSTGSNEVELDIPLQQRLSLYAGPGFIKSPEPRMLPMPSPFMRRVSLVASTG